MLTFNKTKLKKLISFSFLTLFLISFLLPFTASATVRWYYTTSSYDKMHVFNTEALCNTERTTKISSGIIDKATWTITKCGKVDIVGADGSIINNAENLAKYGFVLESLTSTSSAAGIDYWFISKNISSNASLISCKVMGPYTQAGCTTLETSEKDAGNTIYQSCKKSTTKPIQPAECVEAMGGVTVTEKVDTELNYYPLAPLPGVGQTCTQDIKGKTICVETASEAGKPSTAFAGYLNAMIKIFIGLCAVLAMVMIIMGGIQYMTSELISGKEEGKKKITQAVLGLILALGAVAILNTINPDLLDLSLGNVSEVTITISPQTGYDQLIQNNISKPFCRTSYYKQIEDAVKNSGATFDSCVLHAMTMIEGAKSVIGHDENVKDSQIISRVQFMQDQKTFHGTPFSSSNTNQQNDDGPNSGAAPSPTALDLGLDLRYSHSVGMFGLTFFPVGTVGGVNYKGTIGGYTMNQIYNNTNNADFKAAIARIKATTCTNNTPRRIFNSWGGSCEDAKEGSWNKIASDAKQRLYDECISQKTSTSPVLCSATGTPTNTSTGAQVVSSNKNVNVTYNKDTHIINIKFSPFDTKKTYTYKIKYLTYPVASGNILGENTNSVDLSTNPYYLYALGRTANWFIYANGTEEIGHGTIKILAPTKTKP